VLVNDTSEGGEKFHERELAEKWKRRSLALLGTAVFCLTLVLASG